MEQTAQTNSPLDNYADRLKFVMRMRGLHPKRDQTRLAQLVGGTCTQQTIHYLLDQRNSFKRLSRYNDTLARILHCSADWLATGAGEVTDDFDFRLPGADDGYDRQAQELIDSIKAGVFWPWSVSWERIRRLPPEVLGRIDGYIETRVEEYERANVHKKPRS